MGWAPPAFEGDEPAVAERKRRAYEKMTDLGMAKEQALDLLARFDVERVERQVGWMPYRGAKNPARFLAAAVVGDYEAPPRGAYAACPGWRCGTGWPSQAKRRTGGVVCG